MKDIEKLAVANARAAMVAFRETFGCELRPDTLAEVYTADQLGLTLEVGNNPGFDAKDTNGNRYQIKLRATKSVVDINSFDFDYLVLVIMDADYNIFAIYRISEQQARKIFVPRPDYHRWQTSQAKIIALATRVM